jgi:tetratricopeptide (TPR) repeat protein
MKGDDTVQAAPGSDLARSKVEAARAFARSDPKRRRALLREALSEDPKYEPALQDLSLALLEDENHDEARAVSSRCLAVSPDNDTCRMVSSYALPRGLEADAVGKEAEACLAATPKDAKCLATAIGYGVSKGDLARAAKLTEALTEVAPGAKQTLFASARLASATGHYDDARHDLEEACRQGLEQACFRAEALRGEGW